MHSKINSIFIISITIFVILIKYVVAVPPPFSLGRARFGNIGEPAPSLPSKANFSLVGDQWTWQYVDNFNFSNTNLWPNRYLVNAEYYQNGGPIFLMLRGESPISKSFMLSGAWIDYAEQYGAMCFQLEHRYYGKSFPTVDMSTENLRFLTSEQAVADAASFIQAMNKKFNFTADQPWIIFGGSYAGALAIWLVEDYPHLAYGAVSSSGPVHATLDFGGYFDVVADAFQLISMDCLYALRAGFAKIRALVTTVAGQKELFNKFLLCSHLTDASSLDRTNLLVTLCNSFAYIVQYNNVPTSGNTVDVNTVCRVMTNTSYGSPLDRVAKVNSLVLKEESESCLDYSYDSTIKYLQKTSNKDSLGGDRQWWYQVCSEFGYFQTTDSNRSQIFGNEFSLEFYIQQCVDVFGPNYNKNTLTRNVFETNIYYGGYKPPVTNVVSVQGSIDPWHLLGITRNETDHVLAVFIEGTGHCADIYAPSSMDIPALTAGRVKISTFLRNLMPKYKLNPIVSSSYGTSSAGSSAVSDEASSIANKISTPNLPHQPLILSHLRPNPLITKEHPMPTRVTPPKKIIFKNLIKYMIETYGVIKLAKYLF